MFHANSISAGIWANWLVRETVVPDSKTTGFHTSMNGKERLDKICFPAWTSAVRRLIVWEKSKLTGN